MPQTVTPAAALRDAAAGIFSAALAEVEPQKLVRAYLRREDDRVLVGLAGHPDLASWQGPTLVVGGGKAAAGMASACETELGRHNVSGEVVVNDGVDVAHTPLESIRRTPAGHPLPDDRGQAAAHRILEQVAVTQAAGILCLISGGASSLLACPRPPLSLADKITTTRALLACGADIHELNTVRKHLSLIKGGSLLARARVPLVTLILSDVVGDDPATIGSGPTVADTSTFADALAVLRKYRIEGDVPRPVIDLLRAGVAGHVPETLKPAAAAERSATCAVVGSNRQALAAAARAARAAGWEPYIEPQPLTGDTTRTARAFVRRVLARRRPGTNVCVLAGGETTVQVRGDGRGGRNQEFSLAIVDALAGARACILSAGTDGIDGPTPAAGAFVDGTTIARAEAAGLDSRQSLRRNDAYGFFAALGDLLVTGPTGTNVMDLKIALLPGMP